MRLKMFKKIILLLCTLFYINNVSAEQSLTPQETTMYNEFMQKYENNRQVSVNEINQFLQVKKISAQNLYSILDARYVILLNEKWELELVAYPAQRYSRIVGGGEDVGYAFMISIASFFLGSPIIATGLAIKHYIAPSLPQKIISTGLIGTGATLSFGIPTLLAGPIIIPEALRNFFFIPQGIEFLYESITHKQRNAKLRYEAIANEIEKIRNIMKYLKSTYPELQRYR